jgi:hypothetical protein
MPRYYLIINVFILLLLNSFISSCNAGNTDIKTEKPPIPTLILVSDTVQIQKVTPALKLNAFYKKYINAGGLLIVSSSLVPDEALLQARKIVLQMLAKIPDVKNRIIANKVKVAVMSFKELTTDIPEHSDLNKAFPETNWDTRARGLATIARPVISCAEENLLAYRSDRYYGEDILVHEFAHTIHLMGLNFINNDFDAKLMSIYKSARDNGLWGGTYAISNYQEYFAEGVQCWFNVNTEAIPSNGTHNEINTREELKTYDPKLFKLISLYFYDDPQKISRQPGK